MNWVILVMFWIMTKLCRWWQIIIREAKPGKKFITLDEAVHHTVGGELFFMKIKLGRLSIYLPSKAH
jgi:uncharacterized membrane protein